MTTLQKGTLAFIEDHIVAKGYPPTVREVGGTFGVSEKAAYDRLKALKKKGYIDWKLNIPRSIRVLRRIYAVTRDMPEHGIEAGDYVHVENGAVVAITRPLES